MMNKIHSDNLREPALVKVVQKRAVGDAVADSQAIRSESIPNGYFRRVFPRFTTGISRSPYESCDIAYGASNNKNMALGR